MGIEWSKAGGTEKENMITAKLRVFIFIVDHDISNIEALFQRIYLQLEFDLNKI